MPDETLVSSNREQRLDEAVTAFLEAQEAGQQPQRQEWLARYPDVAAELEQFFADQEEVDRLTVPLRTALQGTPPPGDTPRPGQPDDTSSPLFPSALATTPEGYELLKVLGQGGMGLVYKARQKNAGRLVALKLIRAERLTSESDVQRFRNEAEAAAQLDHPHIVPVYEVGSRQGHFFFSMKLIEGGGLDEQLARFRDDLPGVARLVAKVARAVHHAHQRGILHRDLKPSNILLDQDGQPHVSDFGLAKRVEADASLTQTGAIVGTPSYMAPEQTSGRKGTVTTATDVYGLGAVLYALLTGRPPFEGDTVLETLEQVRQREPERPSKTNAGLDRELEAVCLKCLEKDPGRRYASAEGLAEDLERWLRGEPVAARPPGWAERLWRWMRRHWLAVGSVIGLLLALTAVAGSIGWVVRDRVARRSRSEAVVAAALDDSASWQREGRLPEALSAARRAKGLLATAEVDEALKQQVQARLDDLELLDRLENIRLETMTEIKDGHFDMKGADILYAQTFRGAGLDVEALPAEEAGAHIRRSTVANELAAMLDHWAILRWDIRGTDDQSWRNLLRIARVASPDSWREKIQEALEKRDGRELLELSKSKDFFQLSPTTLSVLGWAVSRINESSATTEAFLRETQHQHPDDFWLNYNLFHYFLMQPQRREEALRFAAMMVALRPKSAGVHLNLGYLLAQTGRLDEAITEFREAIRIKKDYAAAHNNLGIGLAMKGQLEEAIEQWREAVRLKKDDHEAHFNLGKALLDSGQLDQAIVELGECIRLKKEHTSSRDHPIPGLSIEDAVLHYELALALSRKEGCLDEAIEEYREAIRLKNDYVEAHQNLGNCLYKKGQRDQAIDEYREAIRIKKDHAEAHYCLGLALSDQGRIDEAGDEYREAIRLKKDFAEAYCNLGHLLQRKGRFVEALEYTRRGHELGSKNPRWQYPSSAQWVRNAERLVELDGKLSAILKGQKQPADNAERLALAQLCQMPCKRQILAAARFYLTALSEEPKLANDLNAQHRYNAACAAALAGCGEGADADKSEAQERARLRQQALDWLKADLKAYREVMGQSAGKAGPAIAQQMQHWLHDADFAGVRGTESLTRLPEVDREEWKKLWKDVEALRQQAVQQPKKAGPARP